MTDFTAWTSGDARKFIASPKASDDKYSRGVLGIVTGSPLYPGAAVIGVDAALHTGVGMVRYLGAERPTDLVLARRPEAVTVPGRVQAWLLGSGMDQQSRSRESTEALTEALTSGLPVVLDAGGLDLLGFAKGPTVITPHLGELARIVGVDVQEIAADPDAWAERVAEQHGVTVLLKGHKSRIVDAGHRLSVTAPTTWLATAGSGDSLGGILGALLATHSDEVVVDRSTLPRLAATAAVIHGLAGELAGEGGPFTVLDLNAALPTVIAGLLRGYPET